MLEGRRVTNILVLIIAACLVLLALQGYPFDVVQEAEAQTLFQPIGDPVPVILMRPASSPLGSPEPIEVEPSGRLEISVDHVSSLVNMGVRIE